MSPNYESVLSRLSQGFRLFEYAFKSVDSRETESGSGKRRGRNSEGETLNDERNHSWQASNKKLLGTSATLVVTGALLVVTRSY